jgi:hypothetical protein
MTLTSGHYIGHEHDRMIVLFSMCDGGKEIPCAISTPAMDYLDRVSQATRSPVHPPARSHGGARGEQISGLRP